jgi:hypothetical protein
MRTGILITIIGVFIVLRTVRPSNGKTLVDHLLGS